MTYFRYPMRSLFWDYVRAVAGFLFFAMPIAIGKPGPIFITILGAAALLFFLYGLRTLMMQFIAFELREDGLFVHGLRKRFFAWAEMSALKLRYFSTVREKSRRDMDRGWMELKISGPPGAVRLDSDLTGFKDIVEAVAAVVERHSVKLDETTAENLRAFREGGTPPPPEGGIKDEDMRW
jgi:hypothetical protein